MSTESRIRVTWHRLGAAWESAVEAFHRSMAEQKAAQQGPSRECRMAALDCIDFALDRLSNGDMDAVERSRVRDVLIDAKRHINGNP